MDISLRIHYGYTASSIKKNTGIKLLRITDIKDYKVNWEEVPYCEITPDDVERFLLIENDIVFARTGATVGKSYLIQGCTPKAVFASYLIRIQLSKYINPKYLFYFFQSADYWEQIGLKSLGVGQPSVNANSLSNITLLLCPLSEQHRIVEKIEELFSELDNTEEILKNELIRIKIYEASILNKLFKSNTKGWDCFFVKDLFEFIGGGTPSKKQKHFWNGKVCWASVKDINGKYLNDTKDRITEEGISNSSTRMAAKGEVLLVTRISPGRVIISNIDVAINQDLKIVRPKLEHLDAEFIYYLFCAYNRDIVEISSGTTVKGVSLSELNNIQVYIPSFQKCHEIVQELDRIYSHTANLTKEIEYILDQIAIEKHAILKRAFEGKLVTSNSNDESVINLLERIKKEKETYLKNQKAMTQVKTKIKQPKRQLIDILVQNFGQKGFTFDEIKKTIFMSYEDMKTQLFSLIENGALDSKFSKIDGKIIYKISHENKKN